MFNMDVYVNFFMNLLGLRRKRSIYKKEVIIHDPRYATDQHLLLQINDEIAAYDKTHNLKKAPNFVKVFFKYEPDHTIENISERLEEVIEELSNTRDKVILTKLNAYPFMAVKAHTRPFEHKLLKIIAAAIVPVGIFLYLRMWRFRLRLMRDLKVITATNNDIINRIEILKQHGKA